MKISTFTDFLEDILIQMSPLKQIFKFKRKQFKVFEKLMASTIFPSSVPLLHQQWLIFKNKQKTHKVKPNK